MNLRQLAESHLEKILENQSTGFGWPITVTTPGGVQKSLVGFSNDIAQVIDPDTGQAVSGRLASVTLRLLSLDAADIGIPRGVADTIIKPWIIQFDDINGIPYTFKVQESNPDRTLGTVVCLLELYR